MKKLSKEFINKISRNGGVLDTAKYRYVIDSDRNIKRTLIDNLDTTAMCSSDAWEIVGTF